MGAHLVSRRPTLAALSGFLTIRGVVRPIHALSSRMKDIAEGDGDLTARVEENNSDEIGQLGLYFNRFVASIQDMVREVAGASEDVAAASTQGATLRGQ